MIAYPHPRPGSTLDNGATAVAVRTEGSSPDGRAYGHVLAVTNNARPEYVTWAYVVDERGQVTVNGRYFDDRLEDACRDLDSRAASGETQRPSKPSGQCTFIDCERPARVTLDWVGPITYDACVECAVQTLQGIAEFEPGVKMRLDMTR